MDGTRHSWGILLTGIHSVSHCPITSGIFLAPGFLHLGAALADLELWITFANHVNSATSFHNLAVGMAIFQRTNAADNFHRIDLFGRIVQVVLFGYEGAKSSVPGPNLQRLTPPSCHLGIHMTKTAYFDCISGISGDMTLGALVDLGLEVKAIESAVQSMGLPDLRVTAETVKKCGFRAIQVHISHPPEHAHRHLHHIAEMIDRATEIPESAKQLAHRIFQEVAVAEAKVHGTTLEKVHFHEVGAIDSIADIVGTAFALDALGIEKLIASPVPTGTGSITIAHGRVSVPAPATAEILKGIPLASSEIEAELTTPTGAAILKSTATKFGAIPAMKIEAVGYGSGTRNLENQANVLRILMGEVAEETTVTDAQVESDSVLMLETNLDDSSPEQLADCCARLFEAGALDVFQTACLMKKGRMGTQLSILSPVSQFALLEQILFEHSSAIGIRRYRVDRHKLRRESTMIETAYGPVQAKIVTLLNGQARITVEDDDARSAAKKAGVSADQVRRDAETKYSSA